MIKNSLDRIVPFNPYEGVQKVKTTTFISPKKDKTYDYDKYSEDLDKLLQELNLHDGMTFSFHHHLRNGDFVLNMVMEKIAALGIKDITICASSLFPVHQPLVKMFEEEIVTKVYAAYISGPVALAISEGKVKDVCVMHSHGYRSTMLQTGEVKVDVAFIAAPGSSKEGNLSGSEGPSSCGVLGYAVADAHFAKKVVAITDHICEPKDIEIPKECVDYVVKVDRIGDPQGIVSGTTKITKDPVGLRIAKMTAQLMKATGLLKDGFSFQTGAGGISLAVAKEVRDIMVQENIKGGFASGGTTSYLTNMLQEGLFKNIYDVQCFELDAVESIKNNPNHKKISAYDYADILNENNVANKLDFVILGASEIDLDYNVNVSTGTDGTILGGSGGHSDTAAGAKLSIIVSKLVSSRISVLTKRVTTVTTPGETIDVLVTDRGIAINPRHQELIAHLKETTQLPIKTMEELYDIAISLTGQPASVKLSDEVVALSQYRDGTIIDVLYKTT